MTPDGAACAIGGLERQPVKNHLKAEWLDGLRENAGAYRFAGW